MSENLMQTHWNAMCGNTLANMIPIYEKIIKKTPTPLAYIALAHSYYRTEKYDAFASTLDQFYAQEAILQLMNPPSENSEPLLSTQDLFNSNIIMNALASDANLSGRFAVACRLWRDITILRTSFLKLSNMSTEEFTILDNEWTTRIGHIAHIDFIIKAKLLGKLPQKNVIIAIPDDLIGNREFLSYWEDYAPVFTKSPFTEKFLSNYYFFKTSFNYLKLNDGRENFSLLVAGQLEKDWVTQNRPPLLKIKQKHKEEGENYLSKCGMKPSDWFVALHARSSGFHRDISHRTGRNAEIETYLPAIEAITRQGGWVIRLGDSSMPPLPKMEHVIDYAISEEKTPVLDLFLTTQCRFLLCTNSGLCFTAAIFGTPVLATNWHPFPVRPWYANCTFMPKLIRKQGGDFIPMSQMLQEPIVNVENLTLLHDLQLELVDHTSQEILDAVHEMLTPIKEDAHYTQLLQRFNQITDPDHYYGLEKVPRSFLEKYEHLIK